MAHGPPPKDPVQRRRRNAEVRVELPAVAVVGPLLDGDWSVETRRWYETWRSSPQAPMFTVTDWQRLTMLAPIVEKYFASFDVKLLAEIRLNESLLGATAVDRQRLRWDLKKPDSQPALASVRQLQVRDAG